MKMTVFTTVILALVNGWKEAQQNNNYSNTKTSLLLDRAREKVNSWEREKNEKECTVADQRSRFDDCLVLQNRTRQSQSYENNSRNKKHKKKRSASFLSQPRKIPLNSISICKKYTYGVDPPWLLYFKLFFCVKRIKPSKKNTLVYDVEILERYVWKTCCR